MGLYIDCALVADVANVKERFPLAGVTTNPSILLAALHAGQRLDDLAVVRALVAVDLPVVMAQPVGEGEEALYAAAMRYIALAPERVVPTLLLTPVGLATGRRLKQSGKRIAFTRVSTVEQAYCAAEAGADWVIPYVGRLRLAGTDPSERIARMARLFQRGTSAPRILAASVKSPPDLVEALLAGADDVTAGPQVIEALLADPLTEAASSQFDDDWRRLQAGLGAS